MTNRSQNVEEMVGTLLQRSDVLAYAHRPYENTARSVSARGTLFFSGSFSLKGESSSFLGKDKQNRNAALNTRAEMCCFNHACGVSVFFCRVHCCLSSKK